MITVWDRDTENLFVPFDQVDEFDFDFVKPAGGLYTDCFLGDRIPPKSR